MLIPNLTARHIQRLAADPMVIPQLNDPFEPEHTYAQLIMMHIDFVTDPQSIIDTDSPTSIY